jgi:thioredoxin
MPMEKVLHVHQHDWQAIEASARPVLVDFWAEWCAPCRAFVPTFDKLAERYGNEIVFAKVNVDEEQGLADRYAIRSIPTILLLRKGNAVERWVGARSYQELAEVLERQAVAVTREKHEEQLANRE